MLVMQRLNIRALQRPKMRGGGELNKCSCWQRQLFAWLLVSLLIKATSSMKNKGGFI